MADRELVLERILLAADGRNERCGEAAAALGRSLERNGLAAIPAGEAGALRETDLLVVLGGDGFLMHTLTDLGHPPIAVFGLNYGQVGFLMNRPTRARDLAAILREGRYHVTELPIISAAVVDEGGEREVCAINDLVLERVSGHTTHLDVSIEGVFLNRYSGDGLIVATAAGSTAYTLAAGGPVVHTGVRALIVTPVNAHRPVQFHSLQFPLVLPLESRIDVEVLEREARPTRLVADGTPAGTPRTVSIGSSRRSVHLVRTEDFDYVGSLVQKVIGSGRA